MKTNIPYALTIAGSDSGGGAGIQQDIRVFSELKVFASSVITALTAQNSLGVQAVEAVEAGFVRAQLSAVMDDMAPRFIKTGMLVNAAIIRETASVLSLQSGITLVIDTVMLSKNAKPLIDREGVESMISHLFPLATLITPNIPEAEALTNMTIATISDMERAAGEIQKLSGGDAAVLIKGGHLAGDRTVDILLHDGEMTLFQKGRIANRHTHGTGCTLSSAITGLMALGYSLKGACDIGISLVGEAIKNACPMGRGTGVLNISSWRETELFRKIFSVDKPDIQGEPC